MPGSSHGVYERALRRKEEWLDKAVFLSGPSRHNTQKIRKHRLKIGVTRDMNAAAGALVNTKNPNGIEAFRYSSKRTKRN